MADPANGSTRNAGDKGARISVQRSGLSLRRLFTTEGVHPYDDVKWERRDVLQTNWKSGETVFEQRDVEFPDFWSVNASTIVTTKYFRGALGTEQREHSLKQLIDRVVLTYVRAGKENGYFATDADAEIFEVELTWMLLHQVFSFNSPVWFNVGTSSPQQVSACQPHDALVSTPAGLIPIGELVERAAVGTKVFDAHGLTSVVAVKHNGQKEVLRVRTKSGHLLDVTGDHLVWRSSGQGSGSFVAASELRAGDVLEWHRRDSHGESEIDTAEVAEAALAGWLQSDGFVGQYPSGTNRSLTIEAMTVTDAELAWVTNALDQVFPGVHRKERPVVTQDDSLDCRRTRLYGEELRSFVDRWDLLTRGPDMKVPAGLFTAPLPVVAAYLRSVFQAEGFVSTRAASTVVEVDMVCEDLIRGVQALLARFGIFARVGFKADRRENRAGTWSLRIQNAGDRRIFADEIGFIDPVKAGKLERSFELPGQPARDTKRLEIAAIESRGVLDVYDIQTDSGEYLSGNIRVHNCFILAVDDTMNSILNWYKEEGLIFKGGSGAGLNISRIRSSKELLRSSGGTASGPVSFMRGADASAGTIKSGGATRRAAKMVVLDVDHPDIEEFIDTKWREEEKIRALRDAGFDMDLGGKDIHSVQYQNANNSVRVTDEFMRAVDDSGQFGLRARTTGEVIETVDAKKLFDKMCEAAWACADPGIQYDDTINEWHTNPETGRITASNPCFTADTRVHTDRGLIRFDQLIARANSGEQFQVYTHDATNEDSPARVLHLTSPDAFMITGYNPVLRLRLSGGQELRCTPGHRFWTENRGFVEAQDLTPEDRLLPLELPAPATNASWELPESARSANTRAHGERNDEMVIPEEWTADLGHYLGWLIGDGSTSQSIATIYGSAEDRTEILPVHQELVEAINGGRALKVSEQGNGTAQLRLTRGAFRRFLEGLGVGRSTGVAKYVPASVFEAPNEVVAAFLRGLFDADGSVTVSREKGSYVSLDSSAPQLLRDTQQLLSTFGITSRIYKTREARADGYAHTRADGSTAHYGRAAAYQLRITGHAMDRFAASIGFQLSRKAGLLSEAVTSRTPYDTDVMVRVVERSDEGVELTYNLTEPRNHSYVAGGIVTRNCSEYMSLDNSSCNLASLNLLKFLADDGTFEADKFARAVEFVITAMDISICFADFPTKPIGDTTRAYRQLGIGYANLGALLMACGLAYDSDGGRALAAAITSLMTGTAYKRSAELAAVVGPYDGYARNADAHAKVMRKHAAATDSVRSSTSLDRDVLRLAARNWSECLRIGTKNGWRNAQASVLAPTGCLTGDSLVTTDRGMLRLSEIGDVWGAKWQDIDLNVSTDYGPRSAARFFVNGEEPTRRIETTHGYRIQGTLAHRIKVIDPVSGEWIWKRLADITEGDLVPMQLGTMIGTPRRVPLPVLEQAYHAGDRHIGVPDAVDQDLAELVGYFMGDGSLHAKGIRFCVADTDPEVIERLRILCKGLFQAEVKVDSRQGYHEVTLQSVALARWWQAAGFAKDLPGVDHSGKGWTPRVPAALRETNDPAVYAAFLRGLFEADGAVSDAVPSLSTASEAFADDVRTLLLGLGLPTTTWQTVSELGGEQFQLRLRDVGHVPEFAERIGFLSDRKSQALAKADPKQSGERDRIHLPAATWNELTSAATQTRTLLLQAIRRGEGVARDLALRVLAETADPRLASALGYVFEQVAGNHDGGVEPTYDLSVPDNVTYVANGFVSHNTIGFMMDCDTTGIEPDFSLVKFKKLVGGGSMQIVNQTVPRALKRLGYPQETIEAIVEHIAETGHVIDAPGLRPEHYSVFDCAMGERAITPMGHVRMMGAVQPFISGAISKCVTGDSIVATEDGLIRIGSWYDAEEADTFRDHIVALDSLDGTQKTDAFYYGGYQPVRRVVLRSGHQITGTPNHRLLTASETGGLQWRDLAGIGPGEYVATKYGADLWAAMPASLRHLATSAPYGSQRPVRLPDEMTVDLALLLGAYAAEGHTTRSNWTVTITNSDEEVLARVQRAWQSVFGLSARVERQAGKCPAVIVSSKTVVEFLTGLGCGDRASEKRIPDAILASPKPMVLAFLQGLWLDAYTMTGSMTKWALCLDSPRMLDDLQAVLTNLGIVHGRVSKLNRDNGKTYDEVHACGVHAVALVREVPFLEADKHRRAAELESAVTQQSTADVVPGISGTELYELLPKGTPGRSGAGTGWSREFGFLLDERTRHVSRRSLERVAAVPGVQLPEWLEVVLRDNLRFSPVESVEDAGDHEVFDVSVPGTHAFVANGIMNHNTVNMPESATIADVEEIYHAGWTMGLKALAIYRDNCKVGQPLSEGKTKKDADAETRIEYRPVRKRLPKSRPARTVSFSVGGAEGYMTASNYPDNGLGEIFLKMSKQGSTLAGMMDAFSIAISIGLQYGVPLEQFVTKFTNMRFEPAGLTDDPDVRMAQSIMDYIFRRLALDHLPYETRAGLGILTAAERAAQVSAGGYDSPSGPVEIEATVEALAQSAVLEQPTTPPAVPAPLGVHSSAELLEAIQGKAADAPLCFTCGTKMRPAGSCYVCEGCGSTSGCS